MTLYYTDQPTLSAIGGGAPRGVMAKQWNDRFVPYWTTELSKPNAPAGSEAALAVLKSIKWGKGGDASSSSSSSSLIKKTIVKKEPKSKVSKE